MDYTASEMSEQGLKKLNSADKSDSTPASDQFPYDNILTTPSQKQFKLKSDLNFEFKDENLSYDDTDEAANKELDEFMS